jgi:glycerophosphoryl diester phosphodiesterase
VNVEVKNLPGDEDFDPSERAAELVVALADRRGHADDILVSSFSLPTVDRVRALDERVPTGLLTFGGLEPLEALTLAADRGHAALHPHFSMLAGDVAGALTQRAHELAMTVNVWTVNDPAEMRRLAAAGIDGIVTDVPEVALEVGSVSSG